MLDNPPIARREIVTRGKRDDLWLAFIVIIKASMSVLIYPTERLKRVEQQNLKGKKYGTQRVIIQIVLQ